MDLGNGALNTMHTGQKGEGVKRVKKKYSSFCHHSLVPGSSLLQE